MNIESIEYGSRAGFWRLHRMFSERGIPVTIYGVAMALERNPKQLQQCWKLIGRLPVMVTAGLTTSTWEETEREHLQKAIAIHTQVTGSRPQAGTGRTSPNTRRLVVEEGGFLYDADSYADDLPYWVHDYGLPHLVIPYTLDNNDMVCYQPGFNSGDQFFAYLRDAFDVL